MQNENEFKIQLHKCKGGYVGELNIPKKIQKLFINIVVEHKGKKILLIG